MDFVSFLEQYGVVAYGIAILFGGLIGVNYMPTKWEQKYKFGLFSAVVAILFIFLEVTVQKTFKGGDATKYLLTFCVVAVCYQYFLKQLFQKLGIVPKEMLTDDGPGTNPPPPPPPPPGGGG